VTERKLAGGKVTVDEPSEAVLRLTLSNPSRRNALDHEILDAIFEVVSGIDDGIGTRCLLITGTEGNFSSGYDIAGIASEHFEAEAEALVAHPFHDALEAVAAHPNPVIAAINGHCLGGGLELALTCDLRICAAGAKLGMPPPKLGLIYSHTGLRKFIDTVGVAETRHIFLTGRNMDARRAERVGLVHEVVPDEEFVPAALGLAEEIAGNAPLSMRGNKRAINTLADFERLSSEQERELIELRSSSFASEDLREGIAAFGEKRKPVWRGR